MMEGTPIMSHGMSSPKHYKIPSNEYGITAEDAARTLMMAQEIKANKELNRAALKMLREKKKAINKIV